MILEYSNFAKILNEKLFEGSSKDLLEKIVNHTDRYVGLFRPTKPKTKLIQNITQSHEIRFGNALESIFEIYFDKLNFELLPKKLTDTESNDELNIDQLFKKENTIYLIEQKLRDDHDSTKKRGQFANFENKYFELSRLYCEYTIIPIMWFVDGSLTKNKRYYESEMSKMANDYACSLKLCYGSELFSAGVDNLDNSMWNEILEYLRKWKETLPEMPEVNFDKKVDIVLDEIKNIKPQVFRKMFDSKEITEQILPVIFPQNLTLLRLKEYFDSQSESIYATLSNKIQQYIQLGK